MSDFVAGPGVTFMPWEQIVAKRREAEQVDALNERLLLLRIDLLTMQMQECGVDVEYLGDDDDDDDDDDPDAW